MCGNCRASVQKEQSFHVDAVGAGGSSPFTVSEMLLKELGVRRQDLDNMSHCDRCLVNSVHEFQRQLVHVPNALLLCVKRLHEDPAEAANGVLARHKLVVEEELSVPGWPRMTLCGVVYHSGQTVRTGHSTAACRGSGGRYWMYDDLGRQSAVLINQDISTVRPTQVHMLMYCRTDLLGVVSRAEVRVGSAVGGIDGHGGHGAAGAGNFSAGAGPDVRSVAGSGVAAGSQDDVGISAHGSDGGHVGARGERRKEPSTLKTPSKRARLALSPGLVERSGSGASGIQPALETPSRRLRAKTSGGSVGSPGAQVCEESSWLFALAKS